MAKKAPQAFRTISEVSDWLDTPTHVLRFWESKFTQVKPVKRAGGRRYYRPSDMELLGGIKVLLHDKGQTIKSVQEMMKEHGTSHVAEHSPELDFPTRSKRKRSKAEKPKETAPVSETAQETQVEKTVSEQADTVEAVQTPAPQTSQPTPPAPSVDAAKEAQPKVEKPVETVQQKTTVDAPNTTSEEVAATASAADQKTDGAAMTKIETDVEKGALAAGGDKTPVVAEKTDAEQAQDAKPRSTEEDARNIITAAVHQRKVEEATEDSKETEGKVGFDTRKPIAATSKATLRDFAVKKAQSDLNTSELALVEDLYYQLRKVRNRIRRSLDG